MTPAIHIHFQGNCQEAFDFYCEHLGAKMGGMFLFKDTPAGKDVPENWQNKIVHGDIDLDGLVIAGDDSLPETYVAPAGFFILFRVPVKKTQTYFDALAAEGEILFPIQKTFFSPSYGIVKDKFGVQWKINGVGKS